MNSRILTCAICILFSFRCISDAEIQPFRGAQTPTQDDSVTGPFWRAWEKGNMVEAAKAFVGESNRPFAQQLLNKLPDDLARMGPSLIHVELTHHNFNNQLIYSEVFTYSDSGNTIVELVYIKLDNHWIGQNIHFHASNETVPHVADAAKREESNRGDRVNKP